MHMQQWEKRIAYLGPEASFTYLATKGLFPKAWLLPFTSIPEVIAAVSEGKADLAVVPLENALEGVVPLTIDYLFHEAELFVTAEIQSKIQQHLLMHKDQAPFKDRVSAIYSHPHALAQCHKFLLYSYSHAQQIQYASTAAAAKLVSESPTECIAAVGNMAAAAKYDLEVVESNIHDFHFNHTRFLVLSKSNIRLPKEEATSGPKTTLMLTMPTDVSGALHQVLSVFAWRKLNLSKIESRPLKTGLGDYFFIIDVQADERDFMMTYAMEELKALGCTVKSLGTYYTYTTPEEG